MLIWVDDQDDKALLFEKFEDIGRCIGGSLFAQKRNQLQASFVDGVWLMGMADCSVVVLQMILEAEMLCFVLAEEFMV